MECLDCLPTLRRPELEANMFKIRWFAIAVLFVLILGGITNCSAGEVYDNGPVTEPTMVSQLVDISSRAVQPLL
jgi:hypothetical protein